MVVKHLLYCWFSSRIEGISYSTVSSNDTTDQTDEPYLRHWLPTPTCPSLQAPQWRRLPAAPSSPPALLRRPRSRLHVGCWQGRVSGSCPEMTTRQVLPSIGLIQRLEIYSHVSSNGKKNQLSGQLHILILWYRLGTYRRLNPTFSYRKLPLLILVMARGFILKDSTFICEQFHISFCSRYWNGRIIERFIFSLAIAIVELGNDERVRPKRLEIIHLNLEGDELYISIFLTLSTLGWMLTSRTL